MDIATQRGLAVPCYALEAGSPIALPAGKTIGPVTGVQVGPDGHVWILHIASPMPWDPPQSPEQLAARLPPICEFDGGGNFVQAWGGPDWLPRESGLQQWPKQEETIALDAEDTLWVFGADVSYDHAVQRFTRDGKLLLRIGRFGEAGNDGTPDLLGCPTDAFHDVARREVYVTDGYVNHRVAVFNSDTGAFLRAWGAYGEEPRPADGEARETFNNPVHAVSLGPEGHLYICDRKNDRVQVFDAVGKAKPRFVREIELHRESPFGTTFNLVFTRDGKFMVINDGTNSRLWTVDLAAWDYVDSFLAPGFEEGDINGTVHKITLDAAGNLFLGRTISGVQRMRYEGLKGNDGSVG